MKPIKAYQTSDGSLFETQREAERHEMLLKKEGVVETFLDDELNLYKGHAHRAMARQTVINWELWKSKNEIIPQ